MEKELQRQLGKMSGLGMAMRACSTFHADTACPPCKIKRVHGALCHDRNSQAIHDVFLFSFLASVPNWPASTVYIAFNIDSHGELKCDKASSW